MAKYKVGDIFINHNDGKILQVCKGGCDEGCCYRFVSCKGIFSNSVSCKDFIGCQKIVKALPSLPPGTKVKIREDLKVGEEYGGYIFNYEMEPYTEVTISCYDTAYNSYQVFENFNHYPLEMFDQVINESKENNNMETKEIKIKVPEGYEIDKENSTFECIKFKLVKKGLTYKDVAEKLFNNTLCYTNERGKIIAPACFNAVKEDKNNATNKKQLERLLALNQLLNVAEYYNKKSPKEEKNTYGIELDKINSRYFTIEYINLSVYGLIPMFNREEDAKAVIDNQNFKDILDLVYKGDED